MGEGTNISGDPDELLGYRPEEAFEEGFKQTWEHLPVSFKISVLVALEMKMDIYNYPTTQEDDYIALNWINGLDYILGTERLTELLSAFGNPLEEENI